MSIDKTQAQHIKNNKQAKGIIASQIETLLNGYAPIVLGEYAVEIKLFSPAPGIIECNGPNGDIGIINDVRFDSLLRFRMIHRDGGKAAATNQWLMMPIFARSSAKERWQLDAGWAMHLRESYIYNGKLQICATNPCEYKLEVIKATDAYLLPVLLIQRTKGETVEKQVREMSIMLRDQHKLTKCDAFALYDAHCGEITHEFFTSLIAGASKKLYARC
jgi:hypothetical protein